MCSSFWSHLPTDYSKEQCFLSPGRNISVREIFDALVERDQKHQSLFTPLWDVARRENFMGKVKDIGFKIHKRALRILYNDYEASFEELLQRNNEQTVHVKNLHKLMTEVYKSLNCQNPTFMWDLFIRKEVTYDLRAKDLLQLPKARTVLNGLNSIAFRDSILWNALPDEIKSSQSIALFKIHVKQWNGDSCNCNICK
eukprot:Seg205.19 transcript_id=Seg205.19/GoldUCD/mRNA.D3Y31 product="hypothetical protein" protein_id=Seg205.19/GoldUCD/D3Y31